MALNAFTRELGITQGRIAPAGWLAPDGSYVFVLGRDLPGLKQIVAIGDYVQVQQVADFAGIRLLRARARTRPPAAATVGAQWALKVFIDATLYVTRLLDPGRVRDIADLAVNTTRLAPGDHTVRFRLELVAV